MTIDVEDRRAALKRALVHLAELCGDEKGIRFGEENLVPAKPLRTTLSELREAGLAEQIVQLGSSKEPYLLTLDGWFTAQKVSGRFGSAEFDARRGRVCAAMKAVTAGRHERVLLDWRKLAAAAEVPAGWLWNVFDAAGDLSTRRQIALLAAIRARHCLGRDHLWPGAGRPRLVAIDGDHVTANSPQVPRSALTSFSSSIR